MGPLMMAAVPQRCTACTAAGKRHGMTWHDTCTYAALGTICLPDNTESHHQCSGRWSCPTQAKRDRAITVKFTSVIIGREIKNYAHRPFAN